MQINNETVTYEFDLEADDKFVHDINAYVAEYNGAVYQVGPDKHKVVLNCTDIEDVNKLVTQTRNIFTNIAIQNEGNN